MLEEYRTKQPTVLKDPFKKDSVTYIHVSSRRNDWDGSVYHYGSVDFENGNTKGEQRFKGSSFDDVVLQIKAFIEAL